MVNTAGFAVVSLIAIIVIFFIVVTVGKNQQQKFVPVKIGNATVNAEVADTEPKQVRGLMFRDRLPTNDGMLFVFGGDGKQGIWMLNMSIPLDIVWIDKDRKVVHVEEKVPPCEALLICPIYRPDSDSRYVLEVNSGYAKRHGIKVGSVAKFDLTG